MRKSARSILAGLTVATTVFAHGIAHAGPDEREQCASSAEQAQQLRDDGKYRRAREQMLFCARESCPGAIKSDCSKWLSELDRDAPTVVFGARDGKGADVVDTRVLMDGAVIQERLDGKPVVVDAGEHVFRFEAKSSGAVKEERVLIRTAEKARSITVTFGAPADTTKKPVVTETTPSTPGSDRSENSAVPAFIVGGIGVVALASSAYFGLSGIGAVDDLKAKNCKPNCDKDEVDSAQSKLIISDIALGVGVVALGVATYMFLTRGSGGSASTDTTKARASQAPLGGPRDLKLNAFAQPGGAFAGIGGRF